MQSLISIVGLSIGFACVVIIFLFIQFELSYDSFHQNSKRIYRIGTAKVPKSNTVGVSKSVTTGHSLGRQIVDEFPEIIDFVRIHRTGIKSVHVLDRHFIEKKFYYADSNFFNFFSYKLKEGSIQNLLDSPYSVVITEQVAKKYFGNENPIGRSIKVNTNRDEYKITGVVENPPPNTHFNFSFIASLNTLKLRKGVNESGFYTYILMGSNISVPYLEEGLTAQLQKRRQKLSTYNTQVFLQSLTDIHLHSHYFDELGSNRDVRYLYMLFGIALMIFLIVCINYVNISTFRFSTRIREVGLRKVFGASRHLLILQFLGETLCASLVALSVSLIVIFCLVPVINAVFGQGQIFNLWLLGEWHSGVVLFGIVMLISFLSGAYPAFFLSKFEPAVTLSGYTQVDLNNNIVRAALVVVQFGISLILILVTLTLSSQLVFMKNHNLGFERDQLITFSAKIPYTLIEEFLVDPRILSVTGSVSGPGIISPEKSITTKSNYIFGDNTNGIAITSLIIDYNYLETLGIPIILGRNFSRDFPTDILDAFIVNETAAKMIGMDNIIGKRLERTSFPQFRSSSSRIIGVVKDFHLQSLHYPITPLVMSLRFEIGGKAFLTHVTARIRPDDVDGAIIFLKGKLDELLPGEPFEFYFLDEVFKQFYYEEERVFELLKFLSMLTVLIIIFGLLGVASFIIEQRKKEIGIRKILGASLYHINYLLMRKFLIWLLVANIIAWPIAYIINSVWLQYFAYHVSFDLLLFLFVSIGHALIVVCTVIVQVTKITHINPVTTIKQE